MTDQTPADYFTNIDRAAEVIADAFRPTFWGTADGIGRDLAHLLDDAGLLMPDDATTQTETVGPSFPEDEDMPDVPDGTDVTRIVGPWVPINDKDSQND